MDSTMINVFQPSLGNEELAAIGEVFKSNWIGKGAKTALFEKKFLEWLNVTNGYTVSVNSCTEGLFQIMTCFDIGSDDEVILPTCHFVGAANAIAANGAKPIFCDIDTRTLNTSARYIEEKISSKTKAVCLLHYGGVPCDLDDIVELCKKHKLILIEDSATAVASSYNGKSCGTFGDVGVWSFDAMKVLVCGDGGMIYIKDKDRLKKLSQSLYLGLLSKSGFTNTVDSKWWEFQIDTFGRREIMNDIAAAMGLVQLKKLPEVVKKRRHIAELYDSLLAEVDWLECPPPIGKYKVSTYYMYWIQTRMQQDRDKLAMYLRKNNVYTTFRYYPLHWVDLYGQRSISLPNAEDAAYRTLCLPIHQSLSDDDVKKIVRLIKSYKEYL